MGQIKFVLAGKKDLDDIFKIFTEAIDKMNKSNIYQWDEVYPDRKVLEDDIRKGQLYIGVMEGKIACAYVINEECDEQYANGDWQYSDAAYYVIHRLCVNPSLQNKGIGRMTMINIENELQEKGIDCIRLDAFSLNPYALKMYDKLGYKKVGIANWRKGKFYLMEKRL